MDILTELAKIKTPGEQITFLKNATGQQTALTSEFKINPDITKYKNEYDVSQHAIFTDKVRFPDKTVVTQYEDDEGNIKKSSTIVPLNRIGLPYQKKIVKSAVTFLFGNDVKYISKPLTDSENKFNEAFKKVLELNKIRFVDRSLAEGVSRFTQAAEFWYMEPGNNSLYGFNASFRIKCKILTPDIYNFYPFFDENENLVAFSREYTDPNNSKIRYFETYTDTKIYIFTSEPSKNIEVKITDNALGKIPFVYVTQPEVEWSEVQSGIERLEYLYSNVAESNDKHAFPILWMKGKLSGQLNNTVAKVMQLDTDAEIGYAVPANASESLSAEITRLERDIHDMTNTPNVSFSNMIGLGNILSGVGSKYLFMSAHLKVMDKMAIFIPALQRRVNIIKAMLVVLNNKLAEAKDMVITPEITPYIIDDEIQKMQDYMTAAGGKPIISQKTAMQKAGIQNPDEELTSIKKETPEPTPTNPKPAQ